MFSAIANERIKEIGIMRAIGAKQSHILRIFLLEVVLLGAIGSVAGIVCGGVLSATLSEGFVLLQNVSTNLTGVEKTGIMLAGFGMGVGICIIGAFIPIFRVKKIEPLLAIREE
jgi:putative ABC transport system permease protein